MNDFRPIKYKVCDFIGKMHVEVLSKGFALVKYLFGIYFFLFFNFFVF